MMKKNLVYLLIILIFNSLSAQKIVKLEKTEFWIYGTALGLFVGPVQSASRSLMIKITPENTYTEMFGFYSFSGKATAFLGPAALAAVTLAFNSQRFGMFTIVLFFLCGLLILVTIRTDH